MFDFSQMPYKSRKRWALVVLVVGLPVYIVLAVTIMTWIDRPSIWIEFAVYVGLGLLWAVPFRGLFRGIGQPDPDGPDNGG